MWSDHRYCTDFRRINALSKTCPYRSPLVADLFQAVGNSIVFSKIDHRSGFAQLHVKEEDQPKTAFWFTPGPGSGSSAANTGSGAQLMMYKRVPFGLKSAPGWYQATVDHEIRKAGLTHCCIAYIDDLLIFSSSAEQHIKDVEAVLKMLRRCTLLGHPDKSTFGAECVEYLGHNISAKGTSPHHAKIAAILRLPAPTDLHTLRMVMGYLSYYRCYCQNFSAIARPITALTAKNVPFQWGEAQQTAFETLKKEISTEGKALRRADPDKPYVLHTDFSKQGIAAVLGQYEDDNKTEYMIACISRSLNKHEANYSSYAGEMLACVWACRSFRHYLLGSPHKFTLITDHQPLQWLMSTPNLVGQHARWALTLQEMDFTIVHRAGSNHQNVDVPSRFPLSTTFDGTGARLDEDDDPVPHSRTAAIQPISTSGAAEADKTTVTNALEQPMDSSRDSSSGSEDTSSSNSSSSTSDSEEEIAPSNNQDMRTSHALISAIDSYTAAPLLHTHVYTGSELVESECRGVEDHPPDISSISLTALNQQQLRSCLLYKSPSPRD